MDNEGTINRMDTIRRITSRRRKAEYTFTKEDGVEQGKTYKVNMMVIDNAGNEAKAYEENEENPEQNVTTEKIETGEAGISITKSTEDPAQEVTLTLGTTTKHQIEYKIGEKWNICRLSNRRNNSKYK